MATTKINAAEQIQDILPVANGGTGEGTLTAHGVVIGNGTSGVSVTAVGTTGQVLQGNTGADPTWGSPAAVPTFVYNEVPTGAPNGILVTFTLANTPTSGTLRLYLNGVRQAPTSDYTLATATITMVVPPATGDTLLADYNH